MSKAKKQTVVVPITIRVPRVVYAAVDRMAEKEERSFNKQAVVLLRKAIREEVSSSK